MVSWTEPSAFLGVHEQSKRREAGHGHQGRQGNRNSKGTPLRVALICVQCIGCHFQIRGILCAGSWISRPCLYEGDRFLELAGAFITPRTDQYLYCTLDYRSRKGKGRKCARQIGDLHYFEAVGEGTPPDKPAEDEYAYNDQSACNKQRPILRLRHSEVSQKVHIPNRKPRSADAGFI